MLYCDFFGQKAVLTWWEPEHQLLRVWKGGRTKEGETLQKQREKVKFYDG